MNGSCSHGTDVVLGNRKGMVPEANMKVNLMDVNTVKTNKVIGLGRGGSWGGFSRWIGHRLLRLSSAMMWERGLQREETEKKAVD